MGSGFIKAVTVYGVLFSLVKLSTVNRYGPVEVMGLIPGSRKLHKCFVQGIHLGRPRGLHS